MTISIVRIVTLMAVCSLHLCALVPSADSTDCAEVFGSLESGESAKTELLVTQNGKTYAWTQGALTQTSSVLHTTLFISDTTAKQAKQIFQSKRSPDGQLRNYRGRSTVGTYDAYCAVDWSMDSRFLLVEHTQGHQRSDVLAIHTWIYDWLTDTRRKVDLSHLKRATSEFAAKKQFRSALYVAKPIGWEGPMTRRVVFAALPLPGENYLGIWSMDVDAQNTRLIAPNLERYSPKRFGKMISNSSSR